MKNIFKIEYIFILLCMMSIQEVHAEKNRSDITSKRNINKKRNINSKRKKIKKVAKNKYSKSKQITRNAAQLMALAEANLEKAVEKLSTEVILEKGEEIFNAVKFNKIEEKDSSSFEIGSYAIANDLEDDDKKFLIKHIGELTIMALYDAMCQQFHLGGSGISFKTSPKKDGQIRSENFKVIKNALNESVNFQILIENKDIVKKMIMAVLKNVFEGNAGESKKGFIGRNFDKLMGRSGNPIAQFSKYVTENKLIEKLDKFDDQEKALKYFACLAAIQLNEKNSFFNNMLESEFLDKLTTVISYENLSQESKDEAVRISAEDQKNMMKLYDSLLSISGAKKPKIQKVPGSEYVTESALSARLMTIGKYGLAIVGTSAALYGTSVLARGVRGTKTKENTWMNALKSAKYGDVAKKDWKGIKEYSGKAWGGTKSKLEKAKGYISSKIGKEKEEISKDILGEAAFEEAKLKKEESKISKDILGEAAFEEAKLKKEESKISKDILGEAAFEEAKKEKSQLIMNNLIKKGKDLIEKYDKDSLEEKNESYNNNFI